MVGRRSDLENAMGRYLELQLVDGVDLIHSRYLECVCVHVYGYLC